ncbi:MAG TPA: hypothetical protein VLJ78_13410 [Microvirga sp.]|jgi:hypothetical protein|nr:hypothetical protein [Microvirga sp.]
MASLAKPERWPDLSGLDDAEASGGDARAALLKVNAEMFVAAPARDREIIETFEALALGFLPTVDHATLVEIARILAPCADTPAAILDYLSAHSSDARDIVVASAAHLPVSCNDGLLATPEGRLQLASRSGIDRATVERLLVLYEDDVEDRLAANVSLAPTEPGFATLVRRAQERASLARILLARADLPLADEAALYLWATHERQARIRDGIAAVAANRRAHLSFTLTEHELDAFFAASRVGDVAQLEAMMSTAFGFPPGTEWRCLQIGRHPLLALAFRALGLGDREATRIFLTLHPALCRPLSAVKALVRAVRDVPAPVALALVEAILGAAALSLRHGSGRAFAADDAIAYRPHGGET